MEREALWSYRRCDPERPQEQLMVALQYIIKLAAARQDQVLPDEKADKLLTRITDLALKHRHEHAEAWFRSRVVGELSESLGALYERRCGPGFTDEALEADVRALVESHGLAWNDKVRAALVISPRDIRRMNSPKSAAVERLAFALGGYERSIGYLWQRKRRERGDIVPLAYGVTPQPEQLQAVVATLLKLLGDY